MKNGKKIILVSIFVLLIILTLVVFLLSKRLTSSEPDIPPIDNEEPINISEVTKIEEYNMFFSIQNLVNENLTISESFVATEIYTKKIGDFSYYFVRGAILETSMINDKSIYKNNVSYLVVMDSIRNYEISILEIEDSLKEYAENYENEVNQINTSKKFKKISLDEEKILTFYLEYYRNLLLYDTKMAYDLFTDEAKSKYTNFEEFETNKIDTYYAITSKIFSYSKKDNTYYIKDDNGRNIIIYENEIMNFKISY